MNNQLAPSEHTLVSVVMPVYNAEPYLALAIESILGQTYKNFEFIIIDDGSSDESLSIIESFASRDSRVKFRSRENRGMVASLNEALKISNGTYIARMDADDVSLPGRFQAQVDFLRSNPQVVCVGADMEYMDEKGRIITRIRQPRSDLQIQEIALKGHAPICHPLAMMVKSALLDVGGYTEECFPAEDLDLWLRLGEVGELANLDELLLQYRNLDTSISASKRDEQRLAAERACRNAWERRQIQGSFEASGHWRPDNDDRASKLEFALKYGWQAYNYKQKSTARVYACKGIRLAFFDSRPWKLLVVSCLR